MTTARRDSPATARWIRANSGPGRVARAARGPAAELARRAALREAALTLAAMPPLVVASEVDQLRERLAAVARGEAFLLQGGDCAETFATSSQADIAGKVRVLLQMAVVLTYGASMPVVKLGRHRRAVRQAALVRPRRDRAAVLPRRHGQRPAPATARPTRSGSCARTRPPPSTLNLLRAYAGGGLASLDRVHAWNTAFARTTETGARYEQLAAEIDRAVRFMRACGVHDAALEGVELYASHEALILEYERALTRVEDGRAYDLSGHFVWVGERTRQMDGAHLDFVSRIANPIGVKLGPTTTPEFAAELVERLDPTNTPGRLTLISRMSQRAGARRAAGDRREGHLDRAPRRLAVRPDARQHRGDRATASRPGTSTGSSTRSTASSTCTPTLGTHPGGLHVELTGDDVTECIGGTAELTAADLGRRYETACDPRLNIEQSLELAFRVAERLVVRPPRAASSSHDRRPADGRVLDVEVSGPAGGTRSVFHHGTPGSKLPTHHLRRAPSNGSAPGDLFAGRVRRVFAATGPTGRRHRRGRRGDARRGRRRPLSGCRRVRRWAAHAGDGCAPARTRRGCIVHCGRRSVRRGRASTSWPVMGEQNVEEFGLALRGEDALRPNLERDAEELSGTDGPGIVAALQTLLPDVDRAVLTDEYGQDLADSIAEGLRSGVDGWLDDDLAFTVPWGFELTEITVPVFLWQGSADLMVPFAHGRWLADRIPGVGVHLLEGQGHLSIAAGSIDQLLDELITTL